MSESDPQFLSRPEAMDRMAENKNAKAFDFLVLKSALLPIIAAFLGETGSGYKQATDTFLGTKVLAASTRIGHPSRKEEYTYNEVFVPLFAQKTMAETKANSMPEPSISFREILKEQGINDIEKAMGYIATAYQNVIPTMQGLFRVDMGETQKRFNTALAALKADAPAIHPDERGAKTAIAKQERQLKEQVRHQFHEEFAHRVFIKPTKTVDGQDDFLLSPVAVMMIDFPTLAARLEKQVAVPSPSALARINTSSNSGPAR